MAFSLHLLFGTTGSPSAFVTGSPLLSRIAVTGIGSHRVPLAASVEYAVTRSSGLVAYGPRVKDPSSSEMISSEGLELGWSKRRPIASAMRTGFSTEPSASSSPTKYVLEDM